MSRAVIPVETWRRYVATRDQVLREELVIAHIPLVKYVASRMLPTLHESVEHRDLVSYGVIGLLDAIERYDPETGHAFSTYAVHRIQGAITDEMRSQAWEPRSVRVRARKVKEAEREMEMQLGRVPTYAELAQGAGMDGKELSRVLGDMRSSYVASLSTVVGDPSRMTIGRQELGDVVPDDRVAVDNLALHLEELQLRMADCIEQLPQRDRDLLVWVYVQGLSFRAIAQALQVSESWVSQLHTQAMVAIQRTMAGASI